MYGERILKMIKKSPSSFFRRLSLSLPLPPAKLPWYSIKTVKEKNSTRLENGARYASRYHGGQQAEPWR